MISISWVGSASRGVTKIVLATAIAGFTIFEVGANAATPVWVTLSMFGLNHLIEANSPEARKEAEEAAAASAATT